MFSEQLRTALAQEVVGQPAAINTIVRGVTRLVSGMTPRERSLCAYLFFGPPGTGRAHLVRSLARILHGEERVFSVSCNAGGQPDPWGWFVQQLSPLFAAGAGRPPRSAPSAPNIVLVQDLECASKQLYPLFARALETGQLPLPGGQRGRLDNCVLVFTTGLCAREILDQTAGFGFPRAPVEDGEKEADPILDTCRAQAEQTFGIDLLSQFDSLVIFRGLQEEHFASVLERHFARMGRWLAQRGVTCELTPTARGFLLERSAGQGLLGARDLLLACRREVEFPVADLLISGQLDPGARLRVERKPDEEHLHFTVEAADPLSDGAARARGGVAIPVT